jgi:peptide/nickel transport system permease protein
MPRAVFGAIVILIILFCALAAPIIVPVGPDDMDFGALMSGPTAVHVLGTDQLGRDVLSRVIYGSRIALLVSLLGTGLGVLIGMPLGLISVYFRRWVDDGIMRFVDALAVLPGIIIAVSLAGAMGGSLTTVVLSIGISTVPWIARVVRSQGLVVREQDFVAAAVAGGMGHFRIITKHILPHTVAPVIVQATLGMGYAVLFEAALGFIGIGVQPPTSTWGNMLQQAYPFLAQDPLLSVVPGVAIFLLVLAFNFVGDSLRDVLDPRMKGLI